MSVKLTDFSEAERLKLPFPDLTALRREAFESAVLNYKPDPRLDEWARRMTRRYKSSVVGIHAHGGTVQFPPPYNIGVNGSPLTWKAALFVAIFGETIEKWPIMLTEDVIVRARAWELGKIPEGVVMPESETA